MIFLFQTTTTMKPHNCKKWCIDRDIIGQLKIEAVNMTEALKQYIELVQDRHYIGISNNALRTKQGMYRDDKNGEPKQVGFVITGSCDFRDDEHYKWSTQYIELWVEISIIESAFECGG